MKKLLMLLFLLPLKLFAQDNFVIEIHGTPPNIKHDIITELHSAYVLDGSKTSIDGVVPSNHLFYSALETSHWFSGWYESSVVFYYAAGDDNRTGYAGTHLHNLLLLPKQYKLPGDIGLGLVVDLGFQERKYYSDNTTLELTPVIDKQFNRLYMSLNTGFVKSLDGVNAESGFIFSPAYKVNYLVDNKHLALGIEYYGTLGPLGSFSYVQQQQHQLFFTGDLCNNNRLILNFGYGIGLTNNTDKSVMKLMIGYKFHDHSKI